MACANGCVPDKLEKNYCGKCCRLLGSVDLTAQEVKRVGDPVPENCKCLNVHGHGGRFGHDIPRIAIPTNMTVAYWVKDKELYSAQLNPYDVAGNPEKGPVELAVGSSEKYFTWALASGEPAPHPGAQVKSNLIEAIFHAVKNDKASWLVDTGKIGSTKQGVISLSYICSTINQIQDASRYLWRINWICCREELSR